jgi:signal transduction histidine kinase
LEAGALLRFRSSVVRGSVAVTWIVSAVMGIHAARIGELSGRRSLFGGVAFLVVVVGASFVKWDRVLARSNGQWIAWGWAISVTAALGAASRVPDLASAAQPLFVVVVALTGLVLDRVKHVFVATLATALIALSAVLTSPAQLTTVAIPALTVAVVAIAMTFVGRKFEQAAKSDVQRLAELEYQRADFQRLYAVATTLAGSQSVAEVVPNLVGTLCRYLEAQTGMVFMYRDDQFALELMNPIWVQGQDISVDTSLTLEAIDGGVIGQVFRSGIPLRLDSIWSNRSKFGVLGEMGISEVLIAPLTIDGQKVGVIAVAEPLSGAFEDRHLEELHALAGSAGLVLLQLSRYDTATEATRRLTEIAKMKSDFVSVVSHELRTPITTILGSLDTLTRPELAPHDPITHGLLETAQRQAQHLRRLIEDLLVASRVDRSELPSQTRPISVWAALEAVAAGRQHDRVQYSVQPEHLSVLADPDHLNRVLINLLDNASKYAPGSRIEITARPLGLQAAISVIDHGPGISPQDRLRVFDKFTQLEHSATRRNGGAGLGLSIAKGLTEAMQGHIAVAETPGGGSTFTILLPALNRPETPNTQPQTPNTTQSGNPIPC